MSCTMQGCTNSQWPASFELQHGSYHRCRAQCKGAQWKGALIYLSIVIKYIYLPIVIKHINLPTVIKHIYLAFVIKYIYLWIVIKLMYLCFDIKHINFSIVIKHIFINHFLLCFCNKVHFFLLLIKVTCPFRLGTQARIARFISNMKSGGKLSLRGEK